MSRHQPNDVPCGLIGLAVWALLLEIPTIITIGGVVLLAVLA